MIEITPPLISRLIQIKPFFNLITKNPSPPSTDAWFLYKTFPQNVPLFIPLFSDYFKRTIFFLRALHKTISIVIINSVTANKRSSALR